MELVAKVEPKHLGLILESNLYFGKYLNAKIKKAKKHIGMIKHLSRFLPFKRLIKCIKLLFVPILTIVM